MQHRSKQATERPSVKSQADQANHAIGSQMLMSRRAFLYGAIGAGAVAAIGIGAATCSSSNDGSATSVNALDVPASALTTQNDFEALDDHNGSIILTGVYDLPYGSLLWVNDDSIGACLLPTEAGTPLAQVGLLFLSSGRCDTVLEKAVGADDGFEIYDVRANSNGLIWTEANILRGEWRIYAAPIKSGAVGAHTLLEEGNETYETPTLAVCGTHALWQVNPRENEATSISQDSPSARLIASPFATREPHILFESRRPMSSPPYVSGSTVTISARSEASASYYQLTNIAVESGEIRDTLTLPRAIAPMEAGYGANGFMFSFPNIYNYDGAIANLGTYTPREKPEDGNYDKVQWFDFARTPSAPPTWCGNLFIVKSTYSVCGVDLKAGTYFAIDVDNGADAYGEYLASTGERNTFVTYTNIDHTPVGEQAIHTCRVKVWTPRS